MPLTVFDAVGKFSADTSDLDQFIVKLEQGLSNASEKAAASTQALKAAQDEFRTSIRAVSAEGGDTADNLAKLAEAEKNLTLAAAASRQEHAALKRELSDTGKAADYSFREARGSMMLVEEIIGVHLPRELNMLLAHIPLVGAAFAEMLPLIGVIAAIAVVAELIDKHEKLQVSMRHEADVSESLAIKQQDMARSLQAANLQLEDQIRKLEGRPETNRLQIALIDVQRSVDELANTYSVDFAKMDKNVETEVGWWQRLKDGASDAALAVAEVGRVSNISAAGRIANEGVEREALRQVLEAEDKLNEARRKLADTDPVKDIDAWRLAAGAVATAAGQVQRAADTAHAAVQLAKPDAHELLASLTDRAIEARGEWQAIAEKIKAAGLEIHKVNQEIANDAAERAAVEAKRAMDQQIANIDAWKSAQHAAYETGRIDAAAWQVAELRATDASAIAHEDYLKKLVSLYTHAGEVQKAQQTQEQLAALQTKNTADAVEKASEAMQKHSQAIRHTREEYDHLIAANVDKEFEKTQHATEALTHAEEELSKAQAKAAETKLADKYRDQESAIQKMASLRLITEQQMNDRLALLENQQANEAVAILEKQLAKQQSDMQAAQSKLSAEKSSPFVSPAQILETETNLKKIQAAVVATQSQIAQQEEKYNKQSEAETKSHYGRALLLAIAYGNELLAQQLKENHASLLAAQAELASAKARGQDTTAIQQQINALKQNEQALTKEAQGRKTVAADLQKETQLALLAAQAQLADAKARGLDTTAINQQIAALQKLQQLQQKAPQDMQQMRGAMQGLRTATQQLTQDLKAQAAQMSQAYASAIMGAIESQKSIGAALEAATKQILMQLATQALAHAIFSTALGLLKLAEWDFSGAAQAFAAAGEFAAVAAVAGAAGMAMPSASTGGGSGAGGPVAGQGGGNVQLGGGSGGNQNQGITHLAGGGVVTHQIMVGDSESGGDADEAVIPLENDSALNSITGALLPGLARALAAPANQDRNFPSIPTSLLAPSTMSAASSAMEPRFTVAAPSADSSQSSSDMDDRMEKFAQNLESRLSQAGREGDTHINMPNLKGILGAGEVKKFLRQVNTLVGNRRATLNSTNTLRVNRRSP